MHLRHFNHVSVGDALLEGNFCEIARVARLSGMRLFLL
jgi:hypothetical protein